MVEPWRALATEYLELVSAGVCATDDENQTRTTLRQYQSVSEEEEAAKLPSTLRRRLKEQVDSCRKKITLSREQRRQKTLLKA
jgi:hypothetical protein